MAQIFISHSGKDRNIRDFFGDFFQISNVRGVFKEIEGFKSREAWFEIQNDIQLSRALFVLLGPHVQKIQHTRDWVIWESALATPMRKEIWVFEPVENLGEIDIIIPHLDHYMPYQQNDECKDYIRQIVESYDDSQVLPTALAGGLVGGALGQPILGFLGGAVLADPSRNRPEGIPIECSNCGVSYRIHMRISTIRCPACNTWLDINWEYLDNNLE